MHDILPDIVSKLNSSIESAQAKLAEVENGDTPIIVNPKSIKQVCKWLKESEFEFNVLQVITGTDYEDRIEVSYVLASFTKNYELILKTSLDKPQDFNAQTTLEIDSVCDVWPAANWQERECFDMLGVVFKNHPDLRRILCSEDWEGYPLRKDYQPAKEWHGMEINPEAKMNLEDQAFSDRQKNLEKEAIALAKEASE